MLVVLVALNLFAASGDGEVRRNLSLAERLNLGGRNRGDPPPPTDQAFQPTVVPTKWGRPPRASSAPSVDAVTLAQINNLGRLILVEGDLGDGFQVERSDRSYRQTIVEAQAGIPEFAALLDGSSLIGAWSVLYLGTVGLAGHCEFNRVPVRFAGRRTRDDRSI